MSDIVDRIDELVDQQLSTGPVDDYNADRYDRCPHCDRHWHGLAITERIAEMYRYGRFDEAYSADEDDSRVLCQGSDFIGPMPAEVKWAEVGTLSEADQPALARIGPNPWDYEYRPVVGGHVTFQFGGRTLTGQITAVEDGHNETTVTLQQFPDALPYIHSEES